MMNGQRAWLIFLIYISSLVLGESGPQPSFSDDNTTISSLDHHDQNIDFGDTMIEYLNDIVLEKMRTNFMEKHKKIQNRAIKILDTYYIMSRANIISPNGQQIIKSGKLFTQFMKYCVKDITSNYGQYGTTCVDGVDTVFGVSAEYDENSFLNTVDIFARENKYLEIGGRRIKTTLKLSKFRVATHLGHKFVFIGFKDETVESGDLFAVDVSEPENRVILANEIDLGDITVRDLAIDQYTGNIFIHTYPNKEFYMLTHLPFMKNLNGLYDKFYSRV